MKHRIGVIGYGGMGGWHVNKIATIENIELAGIWDIRECQREKACEKGIHVYESLEALLADETVDMVLIATPNDVHKPLAIAAMEAGKNVVCEKPVTLNSADLQEMVDTWYQRRSAEGVPDDFHLEKQALKRAFANMDTLGLEGLVLMEDGKIIAMTMGSRLGADTVDVHFEKADTDYPGAYAVINRAFARPLREKYPEVKFLNREDDMGLEGLRKAKLSYYPHHMVEKCWAHLTTEEFDDY